MVELLRYLPLILKEHPSYRTLSLNIKTKKLSFVCDEFLKET
ncbi:hypothetical protein DW143_10910 [Bacillus sonorensis]|nr:hypothetical protein DW143_10910 [Bacillus sonorensis]